MSCLDFEIEELRKKLNSLVINNSLTDERVIFFSQKLDMLLVKYEISKYYETERKKAV